MNIAAEEWFETLGEMARAPSFVGDQAVAMPAAIGICFLVIMLIGGAALIGRK